MRFFIAGFILSFTISNAAMANTSGKILYASIDAKVGYSTGVSEDKSSIQSRQLASYAGDLNLGFRSYFNTIWGVNGEYALIKQLTDPSEVSNSNIQGKMFSVSPFFGFELGRMTVLAKLPKVLSGNYTLDKKNSSNQEVKYSDAKVLGIQLNLLISPISFMGVQYEKYTFKKISIAGSESSLSKSSYLNLSTIALLYGFVY